MSDGVQAAFGDRIRLRRVEAGVSQEKLGELSGLHRTYIGHVERGEVNPTLGSIVKLADALEVDLAELTRGLSAKQRQPPPTNA
jgi:transcriptional regulator with XRE-family HTH domain